MSARRHYDVSSNFAGYRAIAEARRDAIRCAICNEVKKAGVPGLNLVS